MIDLLKWLAQIFAEWPKNAKDRATRRYFDWRKDYEARKSDRLTRARLIESAIVRKEDKLQGS